MANDVNNLNVRFLVDVPPATHFILHSSELKKVYANQLRMDFLNAKGQDYFAIACNQIEENNWLTIWKDQAERRYPVDGDYHIEIATGEETLIDLNTIVPIRECNQYSWTKAGLPGSTIVTMTYTDCDCVVQTIEGTVASLQEPLLVCSFDTPSVTAGGIVFIAPCEVLTPSCPDRVVVFQICNENSVTDDNFDIYLNNTYIGAVDLSAMAQVGSVFIASNNHSLSVVSSDFACPIAGMVVYYFSPLLLQTENVLEMRNTQDNGSGNAGTVGVRNYLLTGTELSAPCVIADLSYGPANGEDATLNFSYTECCP